MDDRIPKTEKMRETAAGTKKTQFINGMSSESWTKRGVKPKPKTIPIGRDMARIPVARINSFSRNQCWLTCVISKTVLCSNAVSQPLL